MNIDVDLVKSAKQGDENSFAMLYDEVSLPMYKYALYSLGNSYDAQDVVSEAFLDALKGLRNLRDESAFKPWIMKILSVKIKRKIREYTVGRNTVEISEVDNLYSDGSDLDRDVSERSAAMEALGKLTPQERQIVVLSTMYGYTTKEIAGLLGCPHGTVSSKLHRSLGKLRTMLAE